MRTEVDRGLYTMSWKDSRDYFFSRTLGKKGKKRRVDLEWCGFVEMKISSVMLVSFRPPKMLVGASIMLQFPLVVNEYKNTCIYGAICWTGHFPAS